MFTTMIRQRWRLTLAGIVAGLLLAVGGASPHGARRGYTRIPSNRRSCWCTERGPTAHPGMASPAAFSIVGTPWWCLLYRCAA
jgi:hypothetical protein